MKRVYYSFIFLLFSFGCSSIEEDKSMLQESINNYEGYHPYDAKDFPLGNHGGPFPASTDSRFTSVGTSSIERWLRPICLQDCPHELLPDALKNENPLNIFRTLNNQLTQSSL